MKPDQKNLTGSSVKAPSHTGNAVFTGSLMIALCCIFRSTDIFFRFEIVQLLPVLTIIFWEHLVDSIAVLPLIFQHRHSYLKLNTVDFALFLLIGCGASALGILCFTQSFHYINPALAVLLQKLQPVITILLGVIILKEKVSLLFVFWAGIALAASYFVTFSLTNPFSDTWATAAHGGGYAVLAAVFWGSGTVWGKLLLKKYDRNFILANRFVIGGAFTFAGVWLFSDSFGLSIILDQSNPLHWKMLYMAIIPGLIATTLFYHGLNRVEASVSSILELVFPVSSVAVMWIFLNKPLDSIQLTASAILLISIIKITSLSRKPVRPCN